MAETFRFGLGLFVRRVYRNAFACSLDRNKRKTMKRDYKKYFLGKRYKSAEDGALFFGAFFDSVSQVNGRGGFGFGCAVVGK